MPRDRSVAPVWVRLIQSNQRYLGTPAIRHIYEDEVEGGVGSGAVLLKHCLKCSKEAVSAEGAPRTAEKGGSSKIKIVQRC